MSLAQTILCRNCGKVIDNTKRKDSIFCDVPCRQDYWEKSGKRKEKGVINDNIPLEANSTEKYDLKPSDINKINEVKQNEKENKIRKAKILSEVGIWG